MSEPDSDMASIFGDIESIDQYLKDVISRNRNKIFQSDEGTVYRVTTGREEIARASTDDANMPIPEAPLLILI